MIIRSLLAGVLMAVPVWASSAWAQSEGMCRSDARGVNRDLTLNGNRLSSSDRLLAEQRLSRAESLCTQDSARARQDLDQLRRDLILQRANRPSDLPGAPGPLGPPGSGLDRR